MSNEIYNCAKCMKDYNSNAYPPVVIDEERYWLENADLEQVRAYGKHNRKQLTAEREAAELANEQPEDGDE